MIFLDSSVNTHHDRTKINVPPHPFSAVGTERIALSLQQFSIRRNWLNINPTNNTGYVYIDATSLVHHCSWSVFHLCRVVGGVAKRTECGSCRHRQD